MGEFGLYSTIIPDKLVHLIRLRQLFVVSSWVSVRNTPSVEASPTQFRATSRSFAAATVTIFAASKKSIPSRIGVCHSGRRRVASENVVAIFPRLVAGEALFVQRLIAGFAVREVGKSPAAGRGVLF